MRLDRVYTEGEALVALRRLGFEVNTAPLRPGLYEVSHPTIGGTRTFTVEQLCNFAEGAAMIDSVAKQGAAVAQ
ncbi:MAG TPA: hypothetical protein VF818_09635 [Ktedonobacterales bacterium]